MAKDIEKIHSMWEKYRGMGLIFDSMREINSDNIRISVTRPETNRKLIGTINCVMVISNSGAAKDLIDDMVKQIMKPSKKEVFQQEMKEILADATISDRMTGKE